MLGLKQTTSLSDESHIDELETRLTTASASVSTTTGSTSREVDCYFDDLNAVKVYIDSANARFAHVTEFTTPFSEQVKTDIRNRIRQDAGIYGRADDLQRDSAHLYVTLRCWTAFWFCAFLSIGILACVYGPRALTSFFSRSAADVAIFLFVLFVGAIFGVIRYWIRHHYLNNRIPRSVEKLAHIVAHQFRNLRDATNKACGQIDERTDFGTKLDWQKRAWGWARIALWNVARARGLDTYTTTVFWKMRVSDRDVERGFRLFKGYLLLVGLLILFSTQNSSERQVFVAELGFILSVIAWAIAWYVRFIRSKKRVRSTWRRDQVIALLLYGVFAVAWVSCGRGTIDLLTFLIGALFVIAFWTGWIVVDERPDEAWTDVFAHVLGEGGIAELNTAFYFDSFARRVLNLVHEILHAGRIQDDIAPDDK